MQGTKCMVRCCPYVAESEIDSPAGRFAVCPLHDAPQVVALLAQKEQPHAFWAADRPIVLSCGELAPCEMHGDFGRAWDDPVMAEIDDAPTCMVGANYDLTRGR